METVMDDDDEMQLAHFLETDLLSEVSCQEELETVEMEDGTKGRQDAKRVHVQLEGEGEEEEEKEQREAKKIRVEAGKINDERLSRALGSCSSSSASSIERGAEVQVVDSQSKKSDICTVNNKYSGKRGNESRQGPKRIDTGIFSQIPPELLYQILKFLSSEDLVSCSLVCRFLNFSAADESLWRRLYCMQRGLLPPKDLVNVLGKSSTSSAMKKI